MMTPTAERRRTHFASPPPLPRGLDRAVWRLGGAWRRRPGLLGGLSNEAERILEEARHARNSSEDSVGKSLGALRTQRNAAATAALPWMVIAMERVTGLWAHPEQVMAALALSRGYLVEAATGEGKTLSVGLAAALSAWRHPTCHVLTANDYLAARDAAWLRPFYAACGISTGCVTSEMGGPERSENYASKGCGVTYTTAKELTADFLRDRLLLGALAHPTRRLIAAMAGRGGHPGLVLRGLFSANVDEADHALIDDAVTPLIISRKEPNPALHAYLPASQPGVAFGGRRIATRRGLSRRTKVSRAEHSSNGRSKDRAIRPGWSLERTVPAPRIDRAGSAGARVLPPGPSVPHRGRQDRDHR